MAISTASVLAFERKLANSDAMLFSGNWEDIDSDNNWQEIEIKEKYVRGTISNRLKKALKEDPAKLDAEIQKPNLQQVDVAALKFDNNTLRMSFTLRVLGNAYVPSACNEPAYEVALKERLEEYIAANGYSELAKRYAANIANARFLWRNRVGAEALKVRVRHIVDKKVQATWNFDATSFNLRSLDGDGQDYKKLVEAIRLGLSGDEFVLLQIDAYAWIGNGQEVFPSQELVLDKNKSKAGGKSKILYSVDHTAALHSQKIGNALRTIDTWYPGADQFGPIPVEPYGAVTSRGKAYRQPKDKMDFYSLLDKWVVKGKEIEVEQQHFVVAVLIRGGVFGEKSE